MAAATKKQADGESETVIENDLYKITFSNRGGRVKSWVLKNYKDKPNGNPLDLVNSAAAEKYGYPLTLWTYDESLRNKLNSALYVATSTGSSAPAEITFRIFRRLMSPSARATSSITATSSKSTPRWSLNGAMVSAFPMWPSGFGDETNAAAYAASQIAYQYDAKR